MPEGIMLPDEPDTRPMTVRYQGELGHGEGEHVAEVAIGLPPMLRQKVWSTTWQVVPAQQAASCGVPGHGFGEHEPPATNVPP
jgi:hypothetical protein